MPWDYNDRCPLENGDYMLPPIMPQWIVVLMFALIAAGFIVAGAVGCWMCFSFHP
jgi:hypothetical protein